MKEAAFLGIHALLLLAALLRQRELEKAAQQFKQRDEQTNDCDDDLQDIAAALRQTRLETLLCSLSLSWWLLR